MSEIDYKARCEAYEKILGVGQYDPVKNAFIVYIKMMNQQIEFLSEFNICTHIGDTDKESPKYKRAIDMIDNLPKMITSVSELRSTLKLTKDDIIQLQPEERIVFAKVTTPESMAESVGELAGGKKQ